MTRWERLSRSFSHDTSRRMSQSLTTSTDLQLSSKYAPFLRPGNHERLSLAAGLGGALRAASGLLEVVCVVDLD